MKRFQTMFLLCTGILITFNLFAFASNNVEYPQENIKLTGKYYAYPIGLEGSPYLKQDWQMGNLNLENGKTAYSVKIQFNIISNDLTFYNESLKRVFVIDKGTITSFVMNPGSPDSLFFIKYTGPEVGYKLKNDDFVHVLSQGKINFLVKYSADVINATESNARDKVYPKEYFFLNCNNQTFETKLSYRTVYTLFPSKKKEIKKMISENRIRKATENNMIKLFKMINIAEGF
jgi:hypothetical protein